jgi:MFS family permease
MQPPYCAGPGAAAQAPHRATWLSQKAAGISSSRAMTHRREPLLPWALAWRLAGGQIVAWGVLYYTFTVVVGPMQAATGWPRTFLNAGLSLGLLAWGGLAIPFGAWIQRRGGRELMAITSAAGGLGFMLMGITTSRSLYLVAWLGIGAGMAGMLYDTAFAVITRAFGPEYRRGITLITLVGGFASTVFIPLAQFAVDHLGWQHAVVLLGGLQIVVGAPLHWLGVPRQERTGRREPATPGTARWQAWWREFRRDVSDPRFVGLALWLTGYSAAITGLIFQIVPALQALRVDNATIVEALACFGPMQVLGRFALTTRGNHFSTLRVGGWAMATLVVGVLILLVAPPRLPWLIVYAAITGAGNGITTIVRGTAVAEVFGRERYAELNGALSAPGVVAKAASPLVLAAMWSWAGDPRLVFYGALALLLVAVAGLFLARRAQRQHRLKMAGPAVFPPAAN